MNDINEFVRKFSLSTIPADLKEPNGVRITLSVCTCYISQEVTFVTKKAERIAEILGITFKDLECSAVKAMITGQPEVMGCYMQRDLAEQRLSQLVAETPFIARACHSFKLVNED